MTTSNVSRRDLLVGIGATVGLSACGARPTAGSHRKLGVALVGIGGVATYSVLPSLQRSQNCRLAALVSSGVEKLRSVGQQFGVPPSAQYTYDNFDKIADNPDIDLVYIALPNAMHAEYSIRAARAGKHVLCEKPMAVTVAECDAMIEASTAARKSLAIAYRLHYSPHHAEMVRSARDEDFGQVQLIRADIGYPLGNDGGWRLNRKLAGGGVLLEQGVYPVNAARVLVGEDPLEVLGYEMKSDFQRFAEVDETVCWTMRFRNEAVAHCAASYTVPANHIWTGAPTGWFELDDAFSADAIQARNSNGKVRVQQVDQFMLQVDQFSLAIQDGERPATGTTGEDGRRDVRIINAVYESIRSGKVVKLA